MTKAQELEELWWEISNTLKYGNEAMAEELVERANELDPDGYALCDKIIELEDKENIAPDDDEDWV